MELQELESLDLHDQTLKSINFDLERKEIRISLDIYDENREGYKTLDLSFYDVENLEMEVLKMTTLNYLDVYTFSVKEIDGYGYVRFVNISEVDGQSWEFSFLFGGYSKNSHFL